MTPLPMGLLLAGILHLLATDPPQEKAPTADETPSATPSAEEKPEAPVATPPAVTEADLDRLAERESALAAILSFIERGEEVPLYQILALTEEMSEERAIESAVTASIEKAESIRRSAEERARERRAGARSESNPPPHPPSGSDADAVASTEPVTPPDAAAGDVAGAAPPPAPPVQTERLVALGGLAAADILLDTGRAESAIALFDAILSRPAEATPYARFRRARCLEALGRADEAIAAFDEVARAAAPSPLATQAAFASRHVAWKRQYEAVIASVEGEKR